MLNRVHEPPAFGEEASNGTERPTQQRLQKYFHAAHNPSLKTLGSFGNKKPLLGLIVLGFRV